MRAILWGRQGYGSMGFVLIFCAIFCFSPYGKVAAAGAQTIDDRLSGSLQNHENTSGAQAQMSPVDSGMQDDGLTVVISDDIDGEDDLSLKRLQATSAIIALNKAPAEKPGAAESLAEEPNSPPPNVKLLTVDETLLLAAKATPTSAETGDKGKTKPAPEPKTSKSSSVSTPLLVGAGIAIVAGAVALAGGGSDSDDSSSANPTSPSGGSGDTSSGNVEVIKLSSLVRIGDDSDYNGNHPDKFKQNRPSGTSWTASFNVNNANTVRSAEFKYTVAGSKAANPVYINGRQAGRLCNPGNTAWNVENCSMIITGYTQPGPNQIMIKCAIDESDKNTSTPYDDVELYDLRIELTR